MLSNQVLAEPSKRANILNRERNDTSSKRYLDLFLYLSQLDNLLFENLYRHWGYKWKEMILGFKGDTRKRILQGFCLDDFVEFCA